MEDQLNPATVACRGLRGATTVAENQPDEVATVTLELISALLERNDCAREDVAAVIFTLTDDLAGASPAAALRDHGWDTVPLMMVREHDSQTLPGCIRVLLMINTRRTAAELQHVYLRGSEILRPDLAVAS